MATRRTPSVTRILLLALAGLSIHPGHAVAAEGPARLNGLVSLEQPQAADFTLTSHTGRPVALSDFRGKLVLLYFGYTHCPGICPTTLAEVGQALRLLGPARAAGVQVLFVSVDPERDTPAQLATYLAHFDPTFVGLTGTPEAIAAVAARHGIYYLRSSGTPATGYVVDHSSVAIVVDGGGRVRVLFRFGTPAPKMAEDLGRLLADGATAAGDGPQIAVESAWTRRLPPVVGSSEFYMVIVNAGGRSDRLVAARSPACHMLELYEAYTDPRGAMGMRPLRDGGLPVPAGGRVELKAGGLHLMCMGRQREAERGAHVPLVLTFQESKEISIEAVIRDR